MKIKMDKRALIALTVAGCIAGIFAFFNTSKSKQLPIIAIANYGPHASLEASIRGVKNELAANGFVENETVRYEVADVGFDPSLIPQMITKLKESHPKVMVVKTTPVAQFARGKIHDIPLVYCDILDPVEAGLIKTRSQSNGNITGSSDQEDYEPFLNFAKELFPTAKTVGVLHATSESNDTAMLKMMQKAAVRTGWKMVGVPVDQARDIPMR
ncbi:MAG: ABC transporter substrate-binding protein, partial [Holosporaceae bacterium]|nr:ABC transporter substrate-binding protein [Holosporaceae bacterium]